MSVKVFEGVRFVCNLPNEFRIIEDRWSYEPNPRTSLVKILQIGLCNSDFSRLFLGSAHLYPLTPGHEIVGVIAASNSPHFRVADKVVAIFPLLPCNSCDNCRCGVYNLCRNYSYLGSRENGGLSSFIEVPNWNIFPFKETINSRIQSMLEPLSVVFHALKALESKNNSLLITGSGFLSYLALNVARYLGYEKIGIVSTSKSNSELFENHFVDSAKLLSTKYDSCVDFSGNTHIFDKVTELLLPKSRIVTVANSRNDTFISSLARDRILRNEMQFHGTWNSNYLGAGSDWVDAANYLFSQPNLQYPLTEISINELPDYLYSLQGKFPKTRVHVHCSS